MTIQTMKQTSQQDFIENFKAEFKAQFGRDVNVTIKKVGRHTLDELKQIVNNNLPIQVRHYPDGIANRTRKKEMVYSRYTFFMLGRANKYSLNEIGTFLGYDHTTVIHGLKVVDDLTTTKDLLFSDIRDQIMDQYPGNV